MKEIPEAGQREGLEGSMDLRIKTRDKTPGTQPLRASILQRAGEDPGSTLGKGQKLLVACFSSLLSLLEMLPGIVLSPLL